MVGNSLNAGMPAFLLPSGNVNQWVHIIYIWKTESLSSESRMLRLSFLAQRTPFLIDDGDLIGGFEGMHV